MSSQGAAGSRGAAPEVPGPHVPVLHCVASPLTPNARSLQEETWTLHAASQTASPPATSPHPALLSPGSCADSPGSWPPAGVGCGDWPRTRLGEFSFVSSCSPGAGVLGVNTRARHRCCTETPGLAAGGRRGSVLAPREVGEWGAGGVP